MTTCEHCGRTVSDLSVTRCPSCSAPLDHPPDAPTGSGSAPRMIATPSVTEPSGGSRTPPPQPYRPSGCLATFLGIFPGIGQLYCGRILRGCVLLFGTLALLALMALIINVDPDGAMGGVAILVWLGIIIFSIFDSCRLARKTNQEITMAIRSRIDREDVPRVKEGMPSVIEPPGADDWRIETKKASFLEFDEALSKRAQLNYIQRSGGKLMSEIRKEQSNRRCISASLCLRLPLF